MRRLPALMLLAAVWISASLPGFASADEAYNPKSFRFTVLTPGDARTEKVDKFSTRIQFFSESKIPYAGVFIRIFNADGIAVFKNLCEKPWIFIDLPAGRYNVVAVDRKQVQRISSLHVKAGRVNTLKLKWPKDVVGY